MASGPEGTSSRCTYVSIVEGRAQYLQIDLEIYKSLATAKSNMDSDLGPEEDKSVQLSKESGVGDSAYYRFFGKENKGMYGFRKGNRLVVIQAGGSGFRMTSAYKVALRSASIRATGKL